MDALSTGLGLGLNDNGGGGGPAGGLESVEREILRVVGAVRGGRGETRGDGGGGGTGQAREGRVVLVLDGLDFLLAATGTTAMEMSDMVGELRSVRHRHPSPFPSHPIPIPISV